MKRSEGPDRAEFVRWALSEASDAVLDPPESRVMALRYDSSGRAQRTLREVGLVLGMSPERVGQIEAKGYRSFQAWHRERRIGELVRWALTEQSSGILKPRESRVIALRYDSSGRAQCTLAEVGRALGVSRERVRQIEAKACDGLRRWRERQMLIELLETKVAALRVTPLAKRALSQAGIADVRALTALSYDDLVARLPYPLGRRVAAVLQELGLTLAGSRHPHHSPESLALSLPALAMLKAAGLESVAALAEMSPPQMHAALDGFRRQILVELEDALHERGLSSERDQDNALTSDRTPIEFLGLPQRAYGALKRARYWSVEELEEMSDADLLARVPQFGVKSLEVARHSIARLRGSSLPGAVDA